MTPVPARRFKPVQKEFCHRLRQTGKAAKVALSKPEHDPQCHAQEHDSIDAKHGGGRRVKMIALT